MKSIATITRNIQSDKDLSKAIENERYTSIEDFINNAKRYIAAIKEGRALCNIGSVSKSGMSRTLKFVECSGSKKHGFRYLNFYQLFVLLGHTKQKDSDFFRVHGCGMDMIFATNYNIIHTLCRLGFIAKDERDILAQSTPQTI